MTDVSIKTLEPKIKRNNLEIIINRGAATSPTYLKFLDRKKIHDKLKRVIKRAEAVRGSKGNTKKVFV